MARKRTHARREPAAPANDLGRAAGESAQKIWLAGLGAFERARSEGQGMFDALVDQGRSLGGKAREAADQALRTLRDSATDAGGRFDKLEQVFEDRVSRSLQRLGVISRAEVLDLSQQVRELSEEVRGMMRQQQRRPAAAPQRAAKKKAKRPGKKAKRGATRG